MADVILSYFEYLSYKKHISENTMLAYKGDLSAFLTHMVEHGKADVGEVKPADISAYLSGLQEQGYSSATVNRRLSGIKSFYGYLLRQRVVNNDPTEEIKLLPGKEQRKEILSVSEVRSLLEAPDINKPKGMRDRAMLTLMYATGFRVSEILTLRMEDVNLSVRAIHCNVKGKERVVPFSEEAAKALENYIKESRPQMNPQTDCLFVNRRGAALTRQAFWKIIKEYGRQAEINKEITPQILRQSFAIHMAECGADLRSLQEMLGHAQLSTTTAYVSGRNERLREVYERTQERLRNDNT